MKAKLLEETKTSYALKIFHAKIKRVLTEVLYDLNIKQTCTFPPVYQ